jgi:hypothetical protein
MLKARKFATAVFPYVLYLFPFPVLRYSAFRAQAETKNKNNKKEKSRGINRKTNNIILEQTFESSVFFRHRRRQDGKIHHDGVLTTLAFALRLWHMLFSTAALKLVCTKFLQFFFVASVASAFTIVRSNNPTNACRNFEPASFQPRRNSMLSLVPSQAVMKSQASSPASASESPRDEGPNSASLPLPVENYIGKLKEMTDSKVLCSVLHEITPRQQNDGFDATCTIVTSSNGASIVGTGWAPSKQKAKHLAARSAFENLSSVASSSSSTSSSDAAADAISNLAIASVAAEETSGGIKAPISASSLTNLPFSTSSPVPPQPPVKPPPPSPMDDPSKRLRGTRPNVDWRAITMSTLRMHPLFEALPPPEEVVLNTIEDCQKFREVPKENNPSAGLNMLLSAMPLPVFSFFLLRRVIWFCCIQHAAFEDSFLCRLHVRVPWGEFWGGDPVQDSWQWDALHAGRLTTSKAACCLGIYEPTGAHQVSCSFVLHIALIDKQGKRVR